MASYFRIFFFVFVFFVSFFLPFLAKAGEVFKTIPVSIPTKYGLFLSEIHYSKKDTKLALRVEQIIRQDLIKVVDYFEYVPRDVVHFNIDPYLRLTNGSTTVFPTNIIELYNFPPSYPEHLIALENWFQGLVLHEFVHATHLDQTRDYLNVGRHIFGTIAKIPASIVPRWFTEGVAVWGESHLLSGGRLSNSLFNKELYLQFKQKDYCKTIDCLDEPGVYPYGNLAYWAGAHFIEYLEDKKPKTIKCLVEENSGALPFFLNTSFENCLGQKAQTLFQEFRKDFIAQNEKEGNPEQSLFGKNIQNVFGVEYFQKGFLFDNNDLFKIERSRHNEALVHYKITQENNEKNPVESISHKIFSAPISNLAALMQDSSHNKFILASFNDDPNFREQNSTWKWIDTKTLQVTQTLNFKADPSYVIPLAFNQFITFSYNKDHWVAREETIDHDSNNKSMTLRTFSSLENIVFVKKFNQQLLLKINHSNNLSTLLLTDLKLTQFKTIYESTDYFELPFVTENQILIRTKDKTKLIEYKENQTTVSTLPNSILDQVTFIEWNDNRLFTLANSLKTTNISNKDIENYFQNKKSKPTTKITTEYKINESQEKEQTPKQEKSYPQFDHFLPHYWMISASNSDNLSNIGAYTSFSDPMGIYTLSALGFYYYTKQRLGGDFSYLQKMSRISDLWIINSHISQYYSKSHFSEDTSRIRDLSIGSSYSFLLKRWTLIPGVLAGSSNTDDFISKRTQKYFGFNLNFIYAALSFNDFIQSFLFNTQISHIKAQYGSSYLDTLVHGQLLTQLTENWSTSLKGTYEELSKKDFSRGVIYAGGTNQYQISTLIHEFYGIPYTDAYGNKVFTARVTSEHNLWDIYRGKNLIPFYFKEAHALFGYETLHTDRIILDHTVLANKTIHAVFAGPRLKLNYFYLIPGNLDLILSDTFSPNGKSNFKLNVILSVGF